MTNETPEPTAIENWKRDIVYHPSKVIVVRSVNDIKTVVSDPVTYPTPIRCKGSHHSTTKCVVADAGTVLDMSQYNRILNIDYENRSLTAQAGVILIDGAKALEKVGLQFYTNLEIGNMTLGSGATGQTKESSYFDNGALEYGQFNSYCIGMKFVRADGTQMEITESANPALMAAMRSSFGLLGVVYEVTFKVKPISAMVVKHVSYTLSEFVNQLDELSSQNLSMMLYLYPFNDRVVVEYRYDNKDPNVQVRPGSVAWKVRNYTWKTIWPFIANVMHFFPIPSIRNGINHLLNQLTGWVQNFLLKDKRSSPSDQIIRYSETGGFASYTFSIWAIDRERYGEALVDYFLFCKDYSKKHGYRCELLNVGYHIAQDKSSLFSYSRNSSVLTLDPVATGRGKWFDFLDEYNKFCSERGGRPLFNQTPRLNSQLVDKAYGPQIREFQSFLKEMDPQERFMNIFFRDLFSTAKETS